jgi:hypothetical protein
MDYTQLMSWVTQSMFAGIPNWALVANMLLAVYLIYDYLGQFTKPVMIGLIAYLLLKALGAPFS